MKQITDENGKVYNLVLVDDPREKVEDDWPKYGGKYFFVTDRGEADDNLWTNHGFDRGCKSSNNIYRTQEAAAMAAKRDRLMRTPNTAKKGDNFCVWDFDLDGAISIADPLWKDYLTQPKFATEEEAESWGKEAQEPFEYFNQ